MKLSVKFTQTLLMINRTMKTNIKLWFDISDYDLSDLHAVVGILWDRQTSSWHDTFGIKRATQDASDKDTEILLHFLWFRLISFLSLSLLHCFIWFCSPVFILKILNKSTLWLFSTNTTGCSRMNAVLLVLDCTRYPEWGFNLFNEIFGHTCLSIELNTIVSMIAI